MAIPKHMAGDEVHGPDSDPESRLYGYRPRFEHEVPLTQRGWVVEQDELPGL